MPRTKEETTRNPAVTLDLVFDDGVFFFDLVNASAAPVYRVSVKFSHEITGSQSDRPVTGIQLFRSLTFLPPEKRIRVFIDTSRSYFARKQPLSFTATVRYETEDGGRFTAEIPRKKAGSNRDFFTDREFRFRFTKNFGSTPVFSPRRLAL